jgi:hypothetical protein
MVESAIVQDRCRFNRSGEAGEVTGWWTEVAPQPRVRLVTWPAVRAAVVWPVLNWPHR